MAVLMCGKGKPSMHWSLAPVGHLRLSFHTENAPWITLGQGWSRVQVLCVCVPWSSAEWAWNILILPSGHLGGLIPQAAGYCILHGEVPVCPVCFIGGSCHCIWWHSGLEMWHPQRGISKTRK